MLAKLAFVMQRLKKISKKFFVMINKDGGGDNFWILWGDTAVMREDVELMGVPPVPPIRETLPGMAVFGRSAVVSPAFRNSFIRNSRPNFLQRIIIKQ